MRLIFGSGFKKKVKKLPKKIKQILALRLRLFADKPFDPLLNNHRLHGIHRHQRSINITGDWRVIHERIDDNTSHLIDIDTHSNLYSE